MDERREGRSSVPFVAGLLLIVAGVILLAMQTLGVEVPFDLARVGWPLFIIAPGIVLLLVGLSLPGAPGTGLAVGGGIVTTVGLLLAYQSSAGHYSSWAYAWALVAPFSVGASMLLWAIIHRRWPMARSGFGAMIFGAVLFLVGFAFFEGVLNLGGERGLAPLGRQALPVALIAAGVLVILTRLWPGSRRGWPATWQDDWRTEAGARPAAPSTVPPAQDPRPDPPSGPLPPTDPLPSSGDEARFEPPTDRPSAT